MHPLGTGVSLLCTSAFIHTYVHYHTPDNRYTPQTTWGVYRLSGVCTGCLGCVQVLVLYMLVLYMLVLYMLVLYMLVLYMLVLYMLVLYMLVLYMPVLYMPVLYMLPLSNCLP